MDPISILIQIAIAIVLTTVAYAIMPRAKVPKPEIQDLEDPTADAGRPIPVVFGTKTVSGLNVLWYGEKTTYQFVVDA